MKARIIYRGGQKIAEYQNGELVWTSPDYWRDQPAQEAGYHVMPDIQPYKSMIDGSIIGSRSQHREHLRANGCIEIGNDSSLHRQPKPLQPPPGLKDRLIENANRFLRSK